MLLYVACVLLLCRGPSGLVVLSAISQLYAGLVSWHVMLNLDSCKICSPRNEFFKTTVKFWTRGGFKYFARGPYISVQCTFLKN